MLQVIVDASWCCSRNVWTTLWSRDEACLSVKYVADYHVAWSLCFKRTLRQTAGWIQDLVRQFGITAETNQPVTVLTLNYKATVVSVNIKWVRESRSVLTINENSGQAKINSCLLYTSISRVVDPTCTDMGCLGLWFVCVVWARARFKWCSSVACLTQGLRVREPLVIW